MMEMEHEMGGGIFDMMWIFPILFWVLIIIGAFFLVKWLRQPPSSELSSKSAASQAVEKSDAAGEPQIPPQGEFNGPHKSNGRSSGEGP